MKIGILGTRGIPNRYGGFEQFAQYLSVGLVQRGHEVVVYTSKIHPCKTDFYEGVSLVRICDMEETLGTAGQFIYDFLSIIDSRKHNFDIILQLGYTSSALFYPFHPKGVPVITNMDGMEWKRSKYSSLVQRFLHFSEKLVVRKSDHLIADSTEIQRYLNTKYSKTVTYIPYGSFVSENFDESVCDEFHVKKFNYDMLVARLEPENSIEMILDGVVESQLDRPFLVVGKHETNYGNYLKDKYSNIDTIIFVGGVYDIEKLNSLRFFSNLYFHGHTVGGTNPSLLEAMGSGALICAHHNPFNRVILEEDSFYFSSTSEVAKYLQNIQRSNHKDFILKNKMKIENHYDWDKIIYSYEKIFKSISKF